jgi:pyruvate/2-oxoglutarate dehydrogenase complex dihydrolipoamide dehydrogenase (E3) component
MSDSEKYDAIIIGSGKGGKILATYLGKQNHKVTLIERDPMMIGGGCINVACIPTKTFIASARLVHSIRRAAEFGIKVEGVSVDWLAVKQRVEAVVSEMRALNLKNFTSFQASTSSWAPVVFSARRRSKWCRTTAWSAA